MLPFAVLHSLHIPHRHGKFAVGAPGECNESGVFSQGVKHGVDAGFHHLFAPHRLVALVLKEVTLQQSEGFLAVAGLCVDCGKVIRSG